MENSNILGYPHKKFSAMKRKRSQNEDKEDDDVTFATELPAKRGFFRPWLDVPHPTGAAAAAASSDHQQPARKPKSIAAASTYHANMVRTNKPRLHSPRAQQRRDRNTLACLKSRRVRQAKQVAMEQEYEQLQQQHEANLQQQIRLSLYYVKFLQQTMAATREPLKAGPQKQKRQDSPKPHATTTKP